MSVSVTVLKTDDTEELKTFKNDKNQRTNKTQLQPSQAQTTGNVVRSVTNFSVS